MDNQHQKISGYRELTQTEIDLMNEIKALGPVIEAVCSKVREHIKVQRARCVNSMNVETQGEEMRLDDAEPEKWMEMGKGTFKVGLMYLTRSVAQPTSF